jgi:magnesium transporter
MRPGLQAGTQDAEPKSGHGSNRTMIVDCAHYKNGARQHAGPMSIADAASCASSGDGFVWLGIHDPTAEEIREIAECFPLHDLAVEDARHEHQRAKFERYERHYFVVLRTVHYDEARRATAFGEIHIFAGSGFAITLRHGAASELRSARERLESHPQLLETGPLSVVWAVLDKVVDDYEPVAVRLTADIEDVEVQVFSAPVDPTERIYFLKREVIEFYRAVHPLLAPLADLQRSGERGDIAEILNYFRDVSDHVERVHDEIAAQRELLSSVLEANLAVLSVRQNETTKQLTIIATIFLPLTFITGFFGMNFGWLVGHISSPWEFLLYGVGTLVVSSVALFAWFRRSGYV